MQAGPAPIPVYRPSYLTDGLEFQGSLVESPANVFYQRIKASRASISAQGSGRFQFQWRSVSDNLLMSPTVMLRFRLKIRSPVVWNQVMQYIAVRGVRGPKANRTELQTYLGDVAAGNSGCVGPPAICFADGDAFTNCCSSINLSFNGTSLSLNRTNQFWRDYMRTQISSEDAARIYKSSGGAYDASDAVGVCVPTYDKADAAANYVVTAAFGAAAQTKQCQAGITLDSGIAERCKTLYALLEPATRIGNVDAAGNGSATRILQVSYPVPVAPLNPWRGYSVPSTSPYKSTPLAIPHFSAGGLDFLIEDFQTAFLRRMGVVAPNVAGVGAYGGAEDGGAVAIEFEADSAELELKYFRLAHTRALKESYRFNVWQAQTFLGPRPPANEQGHDVDGRMLAIGKDQATSAATDLGISSVQYLETNKTWVCQFSTINLAQVPSFLLISAPRMNSEYFSSGATDSNAAVRNKSANLYIKSIKLQVNNAQGHIDKAGGSNEAFIMAERLFEMTRENAGSHYFKEGGFRAWRDSGMAVLLSSAQFAPGLMVSDGVAYPINIDLTLELQNRHVDVTALDIQGAAVHQCKADAIRAQAQATAIFTKIILATTETSATTNAMNYPLDSAERILNSAGSMR
jgi:hypothetical protein